MKSNLRVISILFLGLNFSLGAFCQETEDSSQPFDTIIKKSGVRIVGYVKGKTKFEIIFEIPGQKDPQRINNDIIKEIRYGNGTIEVLEAKSGKMTKEQLTYSEKDWTSVLVANEGSDLSGFREKGEIQIEYTATKINADNASLERNGIVLLRKKAASIGGKVIKVTSKHVTRQYGEFPSIQMKAMVYGVD